MILNMNCAINPVLDVTFTAIDATLKFPVSAPH